MLTSAALLLAVAGAASAQFAGGLNYSTSGPLNVTASQIPQNMRNIWCGLQLNICRELCGQAKVNYCDSNNFAYGCQCANGPTPNISAYEQSLPFFLCNQWIANCVDDHPNNYTGITECRDRNCGTKTAPTMPAPTASSSTSSPASPSSSPAPTTTGSGGSGGSGSSQSTSSPTSAGMAAATQFAASYGTHLLAGGMLAAFGLAL